MARINPRLFGRLKAKLGVSKRRVYALVQQTANERFLTREQAALALAARNGIPIQQYANPIELAELRAATHGAINPATVSQSYATDVPSGEMPNTRRVRTNRQPIRRTKNNSIFVVHGRNESLRESMFDFLRALGLNPMEWSQAIQAAKGANPHVDDVIEKAMTKVQAVVVLMSADEVAKLKPTFLKRGERTTEGELRGQPRPNVILEAGMALGRHSEKTLLVQVGEIRPISDLMGKHIVRLSDDVAKRKDVAMRLQKLKCPVDMSGDDWMSVGDFTV